jgi:hypothetical protein
VCTLRVECEICVGQCFCLPIPLYENGGVLNLLPLKNVLELEGLQHPKLNALQATEALYTVLALQPQGSILVTDAGIGHADAVAGQLTISAFLALANQGDSPPDLVVAPEYSVPWEVLLTAVEAGIVPKKGKLWALGCESLPLGQLDAYRVRIGDKAVIIDERPDLANVTTQRYLNPLVYLFQSLGDDQLQRLVLLVQYKTEVSGDIHNTEATGMLTGNAVYLFGSQPHEVRFLTLICSDAFKFHGNLVKDVYQGLFVLHIQLNNNPRHPLYKPYRKELFKFAGDTELFCLNWAADVQIFEGASAKSVSWKNIGGSAWYLRSPDLDRTDARLQANQNKGLYYSRYEPLKIDALQFHYAPRAFLLQATKVVHHGVIGAASYRTGPHMIAAFEWSNEGCAWISAQDHIDDGFNAIVHRSSNGMDLNEWNQVHADNPVNVERLLAICAGVLGPSKNWHEVTKLDSMRMCEEEVMWRATVDLDPKAAEFRTRRFSAGRMLLALRNQEFNWPVEVEFLKNGFSFAWTQQHPHRNAISVDGRVATLVYAGATTDIQQLATIDSQARQALAHIPDPDKVLDTDEQKREHRLAHQALVSRLCILYQDGAHILSYRNVRERKISSPANDGPVSFTTPARVPTEPENFKSN